VTFAVIQTNMMNGEIKQIFDAETQQDAIAIAEGIVDDYLKRHRHNHSSANALYIRYLESGLMSRIFDEQTLSFHSFDHLRYASLQCFTIYAEQVRVAPLSEFEFQLMTLEEVARQYGSKNVLSKLLQ
jgi:hypothetical protein